MRIALIVSLLVASGCATQPKPAVIYESPRLAVTVRADPQAGRGHDHPATISTEVMAKILKGIRITKRDPLGVGGLLSDEEARPAFSPSEIAGLVPHLIEGLSKALPKDLVTFYLSTTEPGLGKVVTSGGLFVESGRLYLILVNARTPPSAGPFEGTAYELDSRDDPLFSIARYRFAVAFMPSEAMISHAQIGEGIHDRYVDPAKLVVIDLARLTVSSPK
jgi:hypothetical protein